MAKSQEQHIFTKFVGKLKVHPYEQPTLTLGNYCQDYPAKGFVVQLKPTPIPTKSVLTRVTCQDIDDGYDLILHVANYGTKPVSVEVWQM